MQKAYAGYQGIEANLPTQFPPPKKKNFKIAFLNTLASQQVLALTQDAAAAEVKRLGGTMIALNDNVDPNKQVSDLQQALNQHAVGIFVDPIEPGSLDPLIAKAKAQGVKFLGLDTADTLGNPGVIPIQVWQGRDHNAYGDMKIHGGPKATRENRADRICRPDPEYPALDETRRDVGEAARPSGRG